MVSPFDAAESAKLGYYVYLYSDPRNGRPFYIGKGKGNRVFSHLADDADHEKNSRIREIRGAGLQPRIEILAFGLDEETAFKVEAAAIDLVGFDSLTNRVVGRGSSRYGRMSVETVKARLAAAPLEHIAHEVAIIRVSASIAAVRDRLGHRFDGESDESRLALYDATRGTWVVGGRRNQVRYVLAAHEGVIVEVYEVAAWLPAGSTMYGDQIDRTIATADGSVARWEFIGRIASEDVRRQYRLKSVAHLFGPGDMYPVRYFSPGSLPGVAERKPDALG